MDEASGIHMTRAYNFMIQKLTPDHILETPKDICIQQMTIMSLQTEIPVLHNSPGARNIHTMCVAQWDTNTHTSCSWSCPISSLLVDVASAEVRGYILRLANKNNKVTGIQIPLMKLLMSESSKPSTACRPPE